VINAPFLICQFSIDYFVETEDLIWLLVALFLRLWIIVENLVFAHFLVNFRNGFLAFNHTFL
jgi:hypothetical protein